MLLVCANRNFLVLSIPRPFSAILIMDCTEEACRAPDEPVCEDGVCSMPVSQLAAPEQDQQAEATPTASEPGSLPAGASKADVVVCCVDDNGPI